MLLCGLNPGGSLLLQDAPEGEDCKVAMLKQHGACCLCRACFYLKRGSLDNMKTAELVTNLNDNEAFAEEWPVNN
jgi:hypothetical protein